MGLTEVPVIVLDHLSEAQKRAYVIADNKLAENAGWDDEMLRVEIEALQDESFDVNLLGFEDEELARLLAAHDAIEGLTDEDAVPELPEKPICRTGDLWVLGEHKLLVGDSTNHGDVVRLMAGEIADLIFTDPPYNVDYEGYTEQKLKIKGDRMFGESSRSNHKQFLFRRIAWRMQANAYGDLSERARRRALDIANDADLRVRAAFAPTREGLRGRFIACPALNYPILL